MKQNLTEIEMMVALASEIDELVSNGDLKLEILQFGRTLEITDLTDDPKAVDYIIR